MPANGSNLMDAVAREFGDGDRWIGHAECRNRSTEDEIGYESSCIVSSCV